MPSSSRRDSGLAALQTHAPTMRAPPAASVAPSVSPRRVAAKSAAHSGSVARSTDASDEETLPSAVVSPSRLAAVVISPVHAAAAATVRICGARKSPGMAVVEREASSSSQPLETPSAVAQQAAVAATTAHCVAVMGSAWVGSRAIIFSVRKKEVPKPTACNMDQASPQPTATPSPPASSRSATPQSASTAAPHVCGASTNPSFRPSTMAESAGQMTTVSAPRNATVEAGVSTSAMLCEI
mmetsp:Transcript_21276/g.45638  ORF Transcript_21276/g.45638 Transcript_21276/m.45638 type:complete len:240 (+) Transcript_21276:119-838(+)